MGRAAVRIEVANAVVRRALEQFVGGLPDFALRRADDLSPAHLVVLELDEANPGQGFARIRSLLQAQPGTEIFLTSTRAEPQLILEAMRAGAKEFLVLPLKPEEVEQAFDRFRERHAEVGAGDGNRGGSLLAVVGAKAGVGTTTVACSLALALQAAGSKVVLVDMNLRGGDIPAFLDITPLRSLRDVDLEMARLDRAFLAEMLTEHESGLHLLPLGDTELAGGSVSHECADRTLKMLRTMFDLVLVDCGSTIDVATYSALQLAGRVVLVLNLTVPSIRRTKLLYDALRSESGVGMDAAMIGFLVNRYQTREDLILAEARKVLGIQGNWLVPEDRDVAVDSLNAGVPIVRHAPRSAAAKALQAITNDLHGGQGPAARPSFLSGMFRKGGSNAGKGGSSAG